VFFESALHNFFPSPLYFPSLFSYCCAKSNTVHWHTTPAIAEADELCQAPTWLRLHRRPSPLINIIRGSWMALRQAHSRFLGPSTHRMSFRPRALLHKKVYSSSLLRPLLLPYLTLPSLSHPLPLTLPHLALDKEQPTDHSYSSEVPVAYWILAAPEERTTSYNAARCPCEPRATTKHNDPQPCATSISYALPRWSFLTSFLSPSSSPPIPSARTSTGLSSLLRRRADLACHEVISTMIPPSSFPLLENLSPCPRLRFLSHNTINTNIHPPHLAPRSPAPLRSGLVATLALKRHGKLPPPPQPHLWLIPSSASSSLSSCGLMPLSRPNYNESGRKRLLLRWRATYEFFFSSITVLH
jgi:hypothetical protein